MIRLPPQIAVRPSSRPLLARGYLPKSSFYTLAHHTPPHWASSPESVCLFNFYSTIFRYSPTIPLLIVSKILIPDSSATVSSVDVSSAHPALRVVYKKLCHVSRLEHRHPVSNRCLPTILLECPPLTIGSPSSDPPTIPILPLRRTPAPLLPIA